MADIATRAGVSPATVSYVLNSKPGARVGDDTRRRIMEVAAELHYRPNAIARAMAVGLTHTVGVYQPHTSFSPLSGMWNTAVTRGIGEALHSRHFHLLLYGYREEEEPPPAAFIDGRVDGLIILAPHVEDCLPLRLAEAGLPVAVVGGRLIDSDHAVCVDVDNVAGGRLATEHLAGLGHRRIAHIAGPQGVPNAIDRQAGYEQVMQAHGLKSCVIAGGFSEARGYQAALEALKRDNRPTALFVANDIAALGALKACHELSLRVPQDVSIVGYDDTPVCELATPPLTSVRQPAQEMGRVAAESLLELIGGRTVGDNSKNLEPHLVVRSSSSQPYESVETEEAGIKTMF
jgi:DNA-binding LacI/PurR family transcriptional regulator